MKKILIFSLSYYPKFIGGAEVAIKEITDRINPLEYQFDMVTICFDSSLPKVEKIGNVNVHRVGFTLNNVDISDTFKFPLSLNKYFFVILGFLKALSLQSKNNYDGIWSMIASYNSFAAVLFKIFNPKVPYLLTLQEGDPISYIKSKVKFIYPMFAQIFKRADHIQVISNYLADYAKEMGYKGEISLVPNGVDFAYFSNKKQETITKIQNEFHKKENDFWLITASRLVNKNAIDDVINALTFLPQNVKFLILGTGPDSQKLETLVDELEVADRVYFVGHIEHEVMPAYLHASDCFIRPSRSEGFGNSFIEAMACDIPVIGTSEGGIVDFLFNQRTGLVCGTNDSNDIAHKVMIYINNIDLKEEVIDNAREMVKEKYDWNIVTDSMRKVFKKTIC